MAMHEESRFRRFPVNEAKSSRFFAGIVKLPTAIVLVDGDPVHAMLVAYVQPFWWGDELESFDLLLYVSPEKRGSSSAARLVNEYKKIAVGIGVVDPKISTGTGVETERTGKFFERMGFERVGLGFSLKAVH